MASVKSLKWSKQETPVKLHSILETLGEYYPVSEQDGNYKLSFRFHEKSGHLQVTTQGTEITVTCDSIHGAARGLGLALAGRDCNEESVFTTLGIMLDCSRHAVMTVDHLKKWLRQLVLMGYNMAMLYTEDTYQLPDEPYFGYMRGPYTMAEIKELDAYAKLLGIELISCIQVLGHMEQILQWAEYQDIKDTRRVMLVDEPRTYVLIEKMIKFWSEALSSRRIHIGMDETHDLGRGRFMDIRGHEREFDIFNRHLEQVNNICTKYGLKSMIWSDMYFRLGNPTQDYYDVNTVIPEDVKKQIPQNVDLVYWDYYHRDRDFYSEWIKRHRDLGHEPLMASGVWTWSKLWCDHEITTATVRPCIEACRDAKISEVFFTLWGDDGSYCEIDSALAGLCWAADLAFGNDGEDKNIEKSFAAICNGNYHVNLLASQLDYTFPNKTKAAASSFLWDDPLMMKYRREISKIGPSILATLSEHYHAIANKLTPFEDNTTCGEVRMAKRAARLLGSKLDLQANIVSAYSSSNMNHLKKIIEHDIPATIQNYRDFESSFRTQWLRHNKKFGLDVIQIWIGGQIARWEEAITTIREFVEGKTSIIHELESHHDVASKPIATYGYWARWSQSSAAIW